MGLLLLRLVTGIAAIVQGVTKLQAGLPLNAILPQALGMIAGILLLVGFWTPVAGSLLAALELWDWIATRPSDPLSDILLGSIGVALALLGPGAWSVDARLFGWKRIDLGKSEKVDPGRLK